MNTRNNARVRALTGGFRPLSAMTLALCAALAAGSAPVRAQTPEGAGQKATLPTQGATVAGAAAPPSAQDANIASMVTTLQKQIAEQQAMLQVLQKQLTSPDAVLAPAQAGIPPASAASTAASAGPTSGPAPAHGPIVSSAPTPAVTPSAVQGSAADAPTSGSPVVPPASLPAAQATATPTASVPTQDEAHPASSAAASVDPLPSAPDVSAPAAGSLTTDAQRQAYASGVTVWREIENSIASQRGLGIELDEHYVMDGLRDMSAHRPLQMSPADITRAMNSLNGDYVQRAGEVKARQEEAGKAYRIAFSKRKGSYSDAGAWYNIADKGQGRHLRTTDLVELSVVGRLPDGTVFDGSGLQGQTKTAKVGALLPAVAIGLQRVGPGGRLTVVIPPAKGYGDVGMPPSIPGGATLIFDITVKGLSCTP